MPIERGRQYPPMRLARRTDQGGTNIRGHTIEFLPYYRLSATVTADGPKVDSRTSITVECLINKVSTGTL